MARFCLVALLVTAGCAPPEHAIDRSDEAVITAAAARTAQADRDFLVSHVEWAINVGGPFYLGSDGIHYAPEEGVTGGVVASIDSVKGSQDTELYQTYRIGDIRVEQPISNGTYDVIFRFAEPFDIESGDRVFTVIVEGEPVILDLDVRAARDGKHVSALDRAASGIEVSDGTLDISFAPSAGEPILNGLIVQRPIEDTRTWELLWNDEFDVDGPPSATLWNYDIWPARRVNDEDQAYTDRPKNVRVEDGVLILEAHKEQYDDAEYTSGRIHSDGKGDVLYGRVEVRAKLPSGQGSWPAIWMLPTDFYRYASDCEDGSGRRRCNAWPNSGEIDIMEHVGWDMQTVHGTVHNRAYYWVNWEQRKGSIEGSSVDSEFHTYSLEWTPDWLTVFMDGSPYFTYVNDGTGWEAWPYDHPFHVILNVAVGGMWGRAGGPIDDSIFPIRMEVDYVRVYQRGGTPQ